MLENENQPAGNQHEVSVFNPVKAKQDEIFSLKANYNIELKITNFRSAQSRDRLVESARAIRDNDDLLSQADDALLMQDIRMMEYWSTQIENLSINGSPYSNPNFNQIIDQYSKACKEYAHKFNKDLAIIQKKNGEGSKTKKDIDNISRLYLALNTPPIYNNLYGIPISPEMEILARALYVRALNEYDNIITITSNGITGGGKTTFALALATTYAFHMTGLGWDWNYNLVINEDKEYVTNLFSHLPQFQIIQLDEAGNQGNRKTWYDSDQIDFMNYMTRLRVHGITTLVIWPDSKEIDPGLASARAAINITINKRGMGIVRGFNRNPFAPKKDYIPNQAKTRVALNASEAHDIMHEFDMVNLLEVPFYKIPAETWSKYSDRKEDSLKVSSLNKRYKKDRFQLADDYYTKFFLSIAPDKIRITAEEVIKFGESEGYAIFFRKLVDRLAIATGRRWKDIMRYENLEPGQELDANKIGYIEVDPYIQQYIERLKAMKLGSQKK